MSRREDILTVLHGAPTATISEVAKKLDINPGSVHHTMEIMEMDGEVARTDEKRWHVV